MKSVTVANGFAEQETGRSTLRHMSSKDNEQADRSEFVPGSPSVSAILLARRRLS
jgi:hypothetical protein